jgi:hypothetical protein
MKNKLLFSLFILVSCTSPKDKLSDNKRISESFFKINIERAEARQEIEYLSDLATKVEYVQLETNKDCIINRAA